MCDAKIIIAKTPNNPAASGLTDAPAITKNPEIINRKDFHSFGVFERTALSTQQRVVGGCTRTVHGTSAKRNT